MPAIGLGCMRLSTEPDRDEARATEVLHAAFDAGIRLLDTADAYCHSETERGHNERLIARAIATWNGDRSTLRVATKGGMVRPAGRWEHDGRARHLVEACHASRRALGLDRLHLYQLHAPDPRVPLATSVRALASLKRDGLVEVIGLCNVTVGQIQEARRIVEIDSVQVELSVWHEHNVLGGVVPYCLQEGIRLLAYRPLGGAGRRQRTAGDPTLMDIARRHGASPAEIALAWMMDLSDLIVPLPGATRVETAASIARARRIALTDGDRTELQQRFPFGRELRGAPAARRPAAAEPPRAEVVLVMGLPGAGKSTTAQALVAQGYLRLNRDETGGTLRDLLPAIDRALEAGASRIVLDNTYVTRKSRAEVLRAAGERGVPVRCLWVATGLEDAQTNAAWRIVSRYGRLPDEPEMQRLRKTDPAVFPPTVQFRYQRELEPPEVSEGFSGINTVAFQRRVDPSLVNRGVVVWCDGVLLRSRSGARVPLTPDDVDVPGDRAERLRQYLQEGWRLFGLSWQPEIAAGSYTHDNARAVFARMQELLRLEIEVEYCPHAAGPPRCWCRKPLPGLGVLLVQRHGLDPGQCLYVGSGPQDPGFARRLGFRHVEAKAFFG
jgi:aryl-alcohol dehydrogenase-like predicted oxidoreductase/histidinol phosphatase-like enzyme